MKVSHDLLEHNANTFRIANQLSRQKWVDACNKLIATSTELQSTREELQNTRTTLQYARMQITNIANQAADPSIAARDLARLQKKHDRIKSAF
jgi:chromosome condensin MukBEF complex kleisin-like MukF subunit